MNGSGFGSGMDGESMLELDSGFGLEFRIRYGWGIGVGVRFRVSDPGWLGVGLCHDLAAIGIKDVNNPAGDRLWH